MNLLRLVFASAHHDVLDLLGPCVDPSRDGQEVFYYVLFDSWYHRHHARILCILHSRRGE